MSDKLFKRRQQERETRKEKIIKQKPNNWLVVCEGEKTEPNYFKAAVDEINKNIENEYKFKVNIVGLGKNTMFLVKSAEDIQNAIDGYKSSVIPYGKIFVVFDKDSFDDTTFNKAIEMCYKNDYIPLWSNQAIEYWFLLHFNYIDVPMDRKVYAPKINEYFKNAGLNYKYAKNDKDIYNKLIKYGSLKNALSNAKNIHSKHLSDKPSNSESCTTVYKFFEEVNERLYELE